MQQETAPLLGSAAPVAEGEALPLHVRVNVENLTAIDTVSQTFQAKVFLEAIVPGGVKKPGLKACLEERYFRAFGILNAMTYEEKYRDIVESGDDLLMHWRVVCSFDETMELQAFPFDEQELNISFTVNNSNEGSYPVKIVPLPEKSQVQVNGFKLGGTWQLAPALVFEVKSSDPHVSGRARTYPIMVTKMYVRRHPAYYMWNVVLPMASFVLMGFTTRAVPNTSAADRLSLSLTLVLTAAAYKFVVASMLPAISYMTLLDSYVTWCSAFLFFIVMENALMSLDVLSDFDETAFMVLAASLLLVNLYFGVKALRIMHATRKRYQ